MVRGAMFLQGGHKQKASRDFAVAIDVSGRHSRIRLEVADDYMRARQFDESIEQYDTWIAANPRGDRLPFALSNACYARALANKELKQALAECRLAQRKVRPDYAMLGHLAFTYLRLGDNKNASRSYKALGLTPEK